MATRFVFSLSSAHGEGIFTLALLASMDTLPRKEAKRFELGGVNKPHDEFLYPGLRIFRQALANLLRCANQPGLAQFFQVVALLGSQRGENVCHSFSNDAIIAESCPLDTFVIASELLAVLFEYGSCVCDRWHISPTRAGARVLCDQPEGHFFASSPNQEWDMGFLDTFGLVDCSPHLVIGPLKVRLLLCPHRQDDLNDLA
jgi:hypothetical protein